MIRWDAPLTDMEKNFHVTSTPGQPKSVRRARHSTRARKQLGQSLAEFALLAPIFIVLTLGVADGGRAFFYREAVTNTARQALRLAAQDLPATAAGNEACLSSVSSVPAAVSIGPRSVPDMTNDAVAKLVNGAATEATDPLSGTNVLATSAAVTITWNCMSGKPVNNVTAASTDPKSVNHNSDSIQVRVTYAFTLITPVIGQLMANPANPHCNELGHTACTTLISATVSGRAEY